MRLHADEVPIDVGLVRRLLGAQAPDLMGLELRPAPSQGTDNLMFRLGEDLVVRLPRKEAAVDGLLVERRWLPELAPILPLGLPAPVVRGAPTDDYPFPWAVCRWLSGSPVPPGGLPSEDVEVLVEFILALQAADPTGGPTAPGGRRAGPVEAYSARFEESLDLMVADAARGRIEPKLVDEPLCRAIWAAAVEASAEPITPVWVHRDLYGGNLLIEQGRLTGVIDFGGLAVADPAGDVMTAFHVLTATDRAVFREALQVPDGTWARARGWALVQGLEALPYYLDTHPGMVAMGRQAILAAYEDARQ